ncbi:MAG: hypothetical protein IJS99_10975 [Synergistaceae bacterium]|nr:hypothetical protein [Synergistaceae bacterium]
MKSVFMDLLNYNMTIFLAGNSKNFIYNSLHNKAALYTGNQKNFIAHCTITRLHTRGITKIFIFILDICKKFLENILTNRNL